MTSPTKRSDFYSLAGIEDIAGFYRDRFYTGGVLNARYFDPLSRFDIHFARTMWVYDNVRPGSTLLDLGCGEGMLALLKKKDVELTGVDLSAELLGLAKKNGYDRTCVAQLTSLPFPDASFDYVVSLDVLGHVSFVDKPFALAEIRRVMRPDGVTMHGIECLNTDLYPRYDEMEEGELAQFVKIDGHIGLETEEDATARFRSFFSHVQSEPRYTLCLSCEEFLKQADSYGLPLEPDFVNYLRGLTYSERRAFNMAMGYVFGRISDLDIKLPKSGLYMFLKASAEPLEPFNNAHRSRQELISLDRLGSEAGWICLDRDSRASFERGFYAANDLPPIARWMGESAVIRFQTGSFSRLRLDLTTHIPDLATEPLVLQFWLDQTCVSHLSLFSYGWMQLEMAVPNLGSRQGASDQDWIELEIRCDRTWQPSAVDRNSKDDRQLSIAICNLEIFRS